MDPIKVEDVLLAFPAGIDRYMPPVDLEVGDNAPETNVAQAIFGEGSAKFGFVPRDGVDPELACRHLAVVLTSYQFGHSRKLRAAGGLLRQWFEAVTHHTDASDPETHEIVWERNSSSTE